MLHAEHIGTGSKGAGRQLPPGLPPHGLSLPSLALGSNYYYLNKIIAKMLHLSTETYHNEQNKF